MKNFIYPAKIEADEDGFFLVTFRDLPFAATDDKTHQKALEAATDCLEEATAMCIDDGLQVPLPSKQQKDEIGIVLPALMAAKAALYITIRKKGLTKALLPDCSMSTKRKDGVCWTLTPESLKQ
jgi:antitoxin HicB